MEDDKRNLGDNILIQKSNGVFHIFHSGKYLGDCSSEHTANVIALSLFYHEIEVKNLNLIQDGRKINEKLSPEFQIEKTRYHNELTK